MTTAQSILDGLQKAMLLRVEHNARRPKGRYSNSHYSGADLREITAQKGVGRPPMLLGWAKYTSAVGGGVYFGELDIEAIRAVGPMQRALRTHGSQRAAARALGLRLSTFQRRLAKEQANAG